MKTIAPGILLIILLSSILLPQKLIVPGDVTRFTPEDGLSQATVTAVYQDSRGLIWLGTADGLNCYDGYSFTVYRHNGRDSNSISDNYIFAITEDALGNLWVGTQIGLNKLDRKSGRFQRFKHNPADSSTLAFNRVTCIYTSSPDSIWIGTTGYLNLLIPATGKITRFYPGFYTWIYKIAGDNRGTLWMATGAGLLQFSLSCQSFSLYPLSNRQEDVRDAAVQGSNIYYVYLNSWAGVINTAEGLHTPYRKPQVKTNLSPECLYADGEYLYIGTGDGKIYRNRAGTSEPGLIYTGAAPGGENSSAVTSLFIDRSGILWAGTDGGGILRINFTPKKFSKFYAQDNLRDVFAGDFIRAIHGEPDGILWLSVANKGLIRFNPSTGEKKIYPLKDPDGRLLYTTSIHPDGRGSFWLTAISGLYIYNPGSGSLRKLHNDFAADLAFISDSVASVACTSSLLFINTHTGKKLGLKIFPPDPENSGYGQSTSLLFVPPHDIYVTTLRMGIIRFSLKDSVLEQYSTQPGSRFRISSNNSRYLLYNQKQYGNVLWAATEDGINLLNLSTHEVTVLGAERGLKNQVVYTMAPDQKGNIWLTTNRGIQKFSLADTLFTSFAPRDGIQSPEFNTNAVYINRSGTIFFGGINGLNYFHPDSVPFNKTRPQIILTGLSVNDKELTPPVTLPELQSLRLAHYENTLNFRFSAAEYTNPEQNQFRYILEGYDTRLSAPSSLHEVRYTGLLPGEYILRVFGSNNDGLWNEEGIELAIIITPPWWQTWWFRTITALTILLLLVFTIRTIAGRKVKKELIRLEQEKKILNERSRIAKDMHDDVGANLSRILFTGRIMKSTMAGSTPESARLSSILQITDETIQKLDQIVWSINPDKDNLTNLIGYISEYTQSCLENANIRCRISIPSELPPLAIPSEARIHIFLIFKEALNNSIKHAGAGTVELRLELHPDTCTITLSDDGRGYNPEISSQGNGLTNMKDRASAAGAQLTLQSVHGSGTSVILTLPLMNLTI